MERIEWLRRDPDEGWAKKAACKGYDPDIFYPEKGCGSAAAKEICRSCVVRDECLEYAVETNQLFGIWGGLNERQRRNIRRSPRAKEAVNVEITVKINHVEPQEVEEQSA
jgi:WhiB family redox-sensing transcriptional regulator